MPRRRDRLRAFMELKRQRRMLLIGIAALGLLAAALIAALAMADRSPEVVSLGKGLASVEEKPVTAYRDRDSQSASGAETGMRMNDGEASYYGNELAGRPTASGEPFDPEKLTAAHRTLPIGSRVRVTNPKTGKSVVVRINDRGPFHGNRVIDLSLGAARSIGLIASGTARVRLTLLNR